MSENEMLGRVDHQPIVQLSCDGRCAQHGDCKGEVTPVVVKSGDGRRTWGRYNYCKVAIAEDEQSGYIVLPNGAAQPPEGPLRTLRDQFGRLPPIVRRTRDGRRSRRWMRRPVRRARGARSAMESQSKHLRRAGGNAYPVLFARAPAPPPAVAERGRRTPSATMRSIR